MDSMDNMSNMDYQELRDYEEAIDAVVEWIGKKWTKSMIKRELREAFPGIYLKTCNFLIYKARKKIRELYGIDPSFYKGSQISFYESVIRGKSKIRDKLSAAERLDKLFGLEQISTQDVNITIQKVQEALKEMDESVLGSEDKKSGECKNESDGQNNAKSKAEDNIILTTNNNEQNNEQNKSSNNACSTPDVRSEDVVCEVKENANDNCNKTILAEENADGNENDNTDTDKDIDEDTDLLYADLTPEIVEKELGSLKIKKEKK